MQIAVCDDTQGDIDCICSHIASHCFKHNVTAYTFAEELLRQIKGGKRYDLLFLDIQMPGLDGWEAAKQIKTSNQKMLITFLTIMDSYVFDAYEYAWRFIPKPISEEAAHKLLSAAVEETRVKQLTVQTDEYITALPVTDIQYVEVRHNNVFIFTAQGEHHVLRMTLSEFERDMSDRNFARAHQSFIVNLNYVKQVSKHDVELKSGKRIPISRNRKDEFWDAYKLFF